MTIYDYMWLCMTLYDGVLICMSIINICDFSELYITIIMAMYNYV